MKHSINRTTHQVRFKSLPAALLLVVVGTGTHGLSQHAWAQEIKHMGNPGKKGDSGSLIARGKYVADGVAMCGDCHTPLAGNGGLDRTRWLEGATVRLKPADPVADWPLQAPRIAGLPPGSDADMVKLLSTGIWRDGKQLRPPMPQFRMTPEDAKSVVAYLKSLNPSPRP
jgi:mono/diheme cytochrome c family protein